MQAPPLTRRDAWVAASLLAVSMAGYGLLAARLAQGRYFEFYNLAFDFDASRVLELLTGFPADPIGFKHPFMLLFRPLGLALLALGVPAKLGTGLIMAGIGAARVALVYVFGRCCGAERAVAATLSLLFAVSGTQLMTALVPETYGFALLSLILVWLVAQRRLSGPSRLEGWRYPVAVITAGITFTNALQPAIAELMVLWRRHGGRGTARPLAVFSAVCCAGFAAVALALWTREILDAVRDPLRAARDIWWMRTKGPTTGASKVLETFLGFSFVSPRFTIVPLPETTRMIDFRAWSFAPPGQAAAAAWLAFLAAGTAAGLAHRAYRPMALALLATFVLNVLFHLDFQFRGSLYLYAAHTHFVVFALAMGVVPWLSGRRRSSAAYAACVVVLGAMMAAVNVPAAIEFAARFDVPDTACPAPCRDGMP